VIALLAAAAAAALAAGGPAQRIEAEALQPGTVVRDAGASGGAALALSSRPLRVSVTGMRTRILVRAPRCGGLLRAGARRYRIRPGRWRSVVVSGGPITLRRRGRCSLRVDRFDVLWAPAPSDTWQWQLSGPLDLSVDAAVYDLDLFETPASVVDELHARGARAVCYFSAGTRERGRPDPYPSADAGKALEDWPDERWLDVRKLHALGPVLERRLDLCARKGFDGAEPDNVDGYTNTSGFHLRAADQLRFNRFIARAAHARGLTVALKNDLDQASALQRDFDWALVEQCFQYEECERLRPFTAAGKAVWAVEYELAPDAFCPAARDQGFMAMVKRLELDAPRVPCW
jgi:hypothetical protein